MRKRRHWSEGTRGLLLLLVTDGLALFAAFALGYLLRFQWQLWDQPAVPTAPVSHYARAWILVGYVMLFLFHTQGLYERRQARDPIDVLRPLLRGGGMALLFLLALSYFYRGFSYSRLSVLYSCVVGLVLLGAFHIAWESYRARIRACGIGTRRIALVGTRTVPRFLAERFAVDRSYGYEIAAVVDQGWIDPAFVPGVPRGGLGELDRLLEETGAEEVLVGHPSVGHHHLLEMIDVCERRQIPIRTVPATYDLLINTSDFEEVGGIPLVTINERRSRHVYQLVKRAFDVLVSGVLLMLSAPGMLVIFVAVRLDSEGPAIYRQRRVGRDGDCFEMLKFRTMVDGAEALLPALVDVDRLAEPVFKLRDDPRVTRLGRYLRRSSLDELPQLWNVLRGQMSLVGPRPEQQNLVERYDIWERRRLKLAPGITGLQQVHCRGCQSLKERVRWDILYLRKQSLLLDLWILLRTAVVVVGGRGAQ